MHFKRPDKSRPASEKRINASLATAEGLLIDSGTVFFNHRELCTTWSGSNQRPSSKLCRHDRFIRRNELDFYFTRYLAISTKKWISIWKRKCTPRSIKVINISKRLLEGRLKKLTFLQSSIFSSIPTRFIGNLTTQEGGTIRLLFWPKLHVFSLSEAAQSLLKWYWKYKAEGFIS